MKYLNLKAGFSVLAASALLFGSCKRIEVPEPIGDAGQTIVKLSESDKKLINLELVNTPQTLRMAEVYRNVANAADLNKTMTVIVKDDPSVVADYNNLNGTAFVPIPSSLFTVDPSTPKIGNNYSVVLKPGEFAKVINFILPSALALDLNQSYAFGFSLVSVDADGKIGNVDKKLVVEVGVKNKWDGKYKCTWTNYHPSLNPGYTGGSEDVEMRTTGANKVKIYFPGIGGFYAPAIISGAVSAFAAQEPEYTINVATNVVTVQNTAPGAVTFYTMAPGYNSRYDEPSKTFFVKWGYTYLPGPVFDPANTREWTQQIKYIGPR